MSGSSGDEVARKGGELEGQAVDVMMFDGLLVFWWGRVRWFSNRSSKKRFDKKFECCKMHRLNRTETKSWFFNKTNRNNLCGYVWRAISVRNYRHRIHVNSQEKMFCSRAKIGYWSYLVSTLLNWRVWSWLRLNAGGMLNTCKSNADKVLAPLMSGGRVSNA